MPGNVTLSIGTLFAFLLVLARVSGALIFVPLPGIKSGLGPSRAALAFGAGRTIGKTVAPAT